MYEIIPDLLGDPHSDDLLRFGRRPGDMGRQNRLRQPDQRGIARRFLREDVQRRSGHVSAADGLG